MLNRIFQSLITILCGGFISASTAFAQAAGAPGQGAVVPGAPGPGATGVEQPTLVGALIDMLPMLAVCYLIFYVMVIRPQERKTKQHKALLESMKRGDSVVTSSGIVGKVSGLESDHIIIEIAPNVKVKFLRQHIVRLENQPQTSKAA
jgi:preprotein translocase subunit YajC